MGYLLKCRLSAGNAVLHVLQNHRLIFSEATYLELSQKITDPKFASYFSEDERLMVLLLLERITEFVAVTEPVTVCRDPKDDKFLELALDGKAAMIISGDKDLLALHPFRGIDILTSQVNCSYKT